MGAEALKVTGINHVVLHVKDLDRSLHFYVDVLGFEKGHEIRDSRRRMSFLRCGLQGLDLFEVADDIHGGEEMNHMALAVAAEELDEAVAALEAAGVQSSERTSRNTVFISDPDGHRIEVLPLCAHERAREHEAKRVRA